MGIHVIYNGVHCIAKSQYSEKTEKKSFVARFDGAAINIINPKNASENVVC